MDKRFEELKPLCKKNRSLYIVIQHNKQAMEDQRVLVIGRAGFVVVNQKDKKTKGDEGYSDDIVILKQIFEKRT